MDVALPLTDRARRSRVKAAASTIEIPQYSRRAILGIWVAAALPMAALAWLVAPLAADQLSGAGNVPMAKALIVLLTIGLVWQFALVAILVRREQGNLRWSTVREALWLRSPQSPRSGRTGGRVWLILIPLVVLFAAAEFLPVFPHPESRDMGAFLESDAGQSFLSGAWGWAAVIFTMLVFNTVLGEELLFRGFLLPRMNGAFGRGDWLANGFLFAAYHLHVPWVFLGSFARAFALAYPTKRYRSAWVGIAVHSAQSVLFGALVVTLVV
ncbi:MAG TPA: CPBP family intramembrane glutamic endopeptidase [Thermoleophilaceae bacterium]|nr:CPBP family intramembrane glutamic endopeptidase [Thermoleophilaceae bacterium]